MNYPSISEYIQALRAPQDNFGAQLEHLRLVVDASNHPVMSSGNFAVVFKMTDGERFYALKCFTKEQAGRDEAYRQIAEELRTVRSSFLVHIDYYEGELFVDSRQTDETEFPVLLMDWVDGVPLDKYVATIAHDREARERLLYELHALMAFLLPQDFAHGDLKPDNIFVQRDGQVKLLDYDGMYVYVMYGQSAREVGSPQYRPRLPQELPFDQHIDDYAAVLILLLAAYNVHVPCDFNNLLKDDPIEFIRQFQPYSDDAFIRPLLAAYLVAAYAGSLDFMIVCALVIRPGLSVHRDLTSKARLWFLGSELNMRQAMRWFALSGELARAESKQALPDTINGHAYVDLGLSVKWATCNVGASSPEDYGDYYAWGETFTKSSYYDLGSKTWGESTYNYDIGGDASLDAARANWGGTWRLPTEAEAQELLDKCDWERTTLGGKAGYKVTGPSGRSIFLPAAGHRYGSRLDGACGYGAYWTSSPGESDAYGAYGLFFLDSDRGVDWSDRWFGRSVRPVSEIEAQRIRFI